METLSRLRTILRTLQIFKGKYLVSGTLVLGGWVLFPQLAHATPNLQIKPISWNIIGLDSNRPTTEGPDTFNIGARVCNLGTTTATDVTATFKFDGTGSASSYLTLSGLDTLTLTALPPGGAGSTFHDLGNTGTLPSYCTDFYFNIVVDRTSSAFDTSQPYYIEATGKDANGTSLGTTVRTPENRELYIEKLVSQERNEVLTFDGPSNVQEGDIVTYTVSGNTAPGGYEQLVFAANFLNTIFQVLSVNTTYTEPSGATNNANYGDACGWDPNIGRTPPRGSYRSCLGPENYTDGKVGGNFTTTYRVRIIGAGNNTVTNLVYDFSGSSFHYNSDLGTGGKTITVTSVEATQADLSLSKTVSTATPTVGENVTFTLTVTNNGPDNATNVNVRDLLPAGLTFVSANASVSDSNFDGGFYFANTGIWSIGTIPDGESATLTLVATVNTSNAITNTAEVQASSQTDPDSTPDNNEASEDDQASVTINGFDYGDAPTDLTVIDATLSNIYPSVRHLLDGLTYLGDRVDGESANQPTVNADGDDTNGSPNDEDGVTFPLAGSTRILSAGQANTLTIRASRTGILNAWMDWNQDGDWADANEQIATDVTLTTGNNTLAVTVPNTTPHGATYARFRFSTTAGLGPTDATLADGEVEDYKVNIALPAPVACEAGVLNDGFEAPVIAGTSLSPLANFSGGNILILQETDIPWWGTISISPSSGTGFNQRNGIELWNRSQTAVSGTLPFEGDQFAEINAFVAGRLYQDFTVPAGTQIRWQVAHRGRAGTDTMGVFLGLPGSEVLQATNTTPNTEWRVYSGIYTVPAGQDVTRFALRAQNTAGGAESSVGNFVDDVRLTNFCAPTVEGYKSVKLIDDVDGSNSISPSDRLTYTLYYVNATDALTGPAVSFQINDPLPAGLTITAAGAQTITVSGNNTFANPNPNYTGAAAGEVSNLLNPGALLDVGGVIKVEIPVTVDANASGILLNQALSTATEFSGNQVLTDNVDSTTAGLPTGVTIPENSFPQTQDPTRIDPTSIPLSSNPDVVLVKRITAINGQPINPNDNTLLNQVVDDTTSIYQDDDSDPGWPANYLVGAINAGLVKPGDTIEYTVYFLSAGTAPAESVRICDRIQPNQAFQLGAYNAGTADVQLQVGTNAILNLTAANDVGPTGDRTELISAGITPSNCNLSSTNDNGTLVVDLTGTTGTGDPALTDLPNSTGQGTPTNSYGYFRFVTKVDE